MNSDLTFFVIPAKAGIFKIPAFGAMHLAGMTRLFQVPSSLKGGAKTKPPYVDNL